MSKEYNETIKQYIQEIPDNQLIEIINEEKVFGRNFSNIYLVVKINRNLYEEGFFNMDICYVLGETVEGRLVVKRIKDGDVGIVDKINVCYPEWNSYDF